MKTLTFSKLTLLSFCFVGIEAFSQTGVLMVTGDVVTDGGLPARDATITFTELPITNPNVKGGPTIGPTLLRRTVSATSDSLGAFAVALPVSDRYLMCISSRGQPIVNNCKWSGGILQSGSILATKLRLLAQLGTNLIVEVDGLNGESTFDPEVIAGVVSEDDRIVVGERVPTGPGSVRFSLVVPPDKPLQLWLFSRKFGFVDEGGALLAADGPSKMITGLALNGTKVIKLSAIAKK